MHEERPDALAMTAEPFHQTHIAWIMDFMAKNRLPAVYQLSEACHLTLRLGGHSCNGERIPRFHRLVCD
jgi:hypothetical protein